MKKIVVVGLLILFFVNFYTVCHGMQMKEKLLADGAALNSKGMMTIQGSINNAFMNVIILALILCLVFVAPKKSHGK
jgi:hypothetical protein